MKKIIFLCVWLWVMALEGAYSQEAETADTLVVEGIAGVREAVTDPSSPYYFPSLMERYLDRDTAFTAEEYRYLYIGYSFQEDYDPYRVSPYLQALDTLYRRPQHTVEECALLIRYAERALADDPFDLRRMSVLVYANDLLDQPEEASFWQERIHGLLGAILSTGDGTSPETAWYIISPTHAFDLLNTWGVVAEAYDFFPPCYDYIQVYDLIGDAQGYYFNVERIFEEYRRKFEGQ
ncbi:MAG: DUF4919 domain-containing protein [Porphyromonadaceae bacterium]|nr:DUF4919 domain-containing protein [Porphyromonadaceae bacterium]